MQRERNLAGVSTALTESRPVVLLVALVCLLASACGSNLDPADVGRTEGQAAAPGVTVDGTVAAPGAAPEAGG
ncbi:MAG: hypothetical protein JWN84_1926, partial [Nocardioides sp.]|nr:hypothetical protein [Nocardioides sp.]